MNWKYISHFPAFEEDQFLPEFEKEFHLSIYDIPQNKILGFQRLQNAR